jgi:hypothetical protein
VKRGNPLKRTRLASGSGPARKAKLNPINKARKKRRKDAGEVYGPYYVLVANLPTCVVKRGWALHRCRYYEDRRPEAHHVKRVGAGGKDAGNLVDVCNAGHDWIHDTPASRVEAMLGFSLADEAVRLWRSIEHGEHD